ncbi:TOTE conflict system archaeo-eukaryotic primase domain-containing protein [Companilactobacillus heilongjiangensis]|uniref:TOTE conflict system archaeo-eukaryotic primase domain-containing protein n=1 Tax=Companilactobacillus heilongjiangensis TaxID=1074467 RepID=UPI000661438B|nr:DEAD/DEAH box helicase family protein [Companilactobacillus heilongjiangensis]
MERVYRDGNDSYILKMIALSAHSGEKQAVYLNQRTQQLLVEPLAEFMNRVAAPANQQFGTAEKIALYRRRFNGRQDVYAKRYYNKKAQRDVYSPATTFSNGRPNKNDYLPLTDNVLKEHLRGNIFIGIFPLLPNDVTNFLVIDIDKQNWQEIVSSLVKICNQNTLPVAIERSQSGNGAHLWFFFEHAISAASARCMGQAILKDAMAINPNISFKAFDRLFPNQDTMPSGGLGNLIAAPLQYQRMKLGRSLFVNEKFEAYADQWDFLLQIQTISDAKVKQVTEKLDSTNDFKLFELPDGTQPDLLTDKLLDATQKITAYRRNQLYILKSQLTTAQINALRYAATFKNPQYYQNQKQRRSNWETPQYISLAEQDSQYVILPRGLEDYLCGKLPKLTIHDETTTGEHLDVKFNGELRQAQLPAQASLLKHNMGVLAARTGFGKTVISASLISKRAVSTLIIVNSRVLAQQWEQRLQKFLTIKNDPFVEYTKTGRKRKKNVIGSYYSGHKKISRLVDVATVQALSHLGDDLSEFMSHYGMVIFDEVHHLAAVTNELVMKQVTAKYIYGLSATPYRQDSLDPIIFMRAGNIAYQTAKVDEKNLLTTKRSLVLRMTNFGMLNNETMANNTLQENYESILNDQDRNQLIVDDICNNFKLGRHQLVLTRRLEQIDILANLIPSKLKIPVFELSGRQKAKVNQNIIAELVKFKKPYVLLATGNYIGEGFDIGSIDTLLLAMPISWKGSTEQYLGRLNRDLGQKSELQVFDYVDLFVPMLARMYQKRLRTYKELQYQISANDSKSVVKVMSDVTGYKQLMMELTTNKPEIVIGVAYLTSSILKLVKKLPPADIVIVTLPADKQEKLGLFNQLLDMKITVKYSRQVLNTVLINDKIVWYDYDQLLNNANIGASLRFNSSALANKFKDLFFKMPPLLNNADD